MSNIIGHGRYARAAYPSRSASGAADAVTRSAAGIIAPQQLQDGDYVPIGDQIGFASWISGAVLSVHAGLSVTGSGDFPAFSIRFQVGVSRDGGSTWQRIQRAVGGAPIESFAELASGVVGLPVSAAIELPGTDPVLVAVFNNGGGTISTSGQIIAYRMTGNGEDIGTELGDFV